MRLQQQISVFHNGAQLHPASFTWKVNPPLENCSPHEGIYLPFNLMLFSKKRHFKVQDEYKDERGGYPGGSTISHFRYVTYLCVTPFISTYPKQHATW